MISKLKFKRVNCILAVFIFFTVMCRVSFAYSENVLQPLDFKPVQQNNSVSLENKRQNLYMDKDFKAEQSDFFAPPTEDISPNEPINTQEKIKLINQAYSKSVQDNTIALSKKQIMNEIENAFSTAPIVIDAFTPLEETKKGVANQLPVVQDASVEIQDVEISPQKTDINVAVNDDETYYNSIDPEQNISLEGKTINSVDIQGLNTVKPEIVLSKISTQIGSKFDSTVLQQDLQNIFSTGYFTDIMAIEPTLRYDDSVDLIFTLQENILVSDVVIEGNTVIPSSELTPFVSSLKGLPQNLNEINKSIEQINDYYHQKGYILETISSVDDNSNGVLTIVINEGIINKITFSGNEKTKQYIIERNTMTREGEVYNEENLKKDLVKIYATQIFDKVDREIKPSEENKGTYDVNVIVKEKVSNNVAVGGGIDSGIGVFGSVAIHENNFRGAGQKLSLSGLVGTGVLLSDASIKNRINYQASLDFFEPYFLNADNSLAGKLYFRELGSYNIPLAIERRFGINGILTHKLQDYDNVTTSLASGIEYINLREGDENGIKDLYQKRGINIAERAKELNGGLFFNIAPGIRLSRLDNEECPREGLIAQARFTEALGIDHTDRTNGRLSGIVTRYFPVFKKSALSLTAKGGIKVHGNDMPEVMAYRLGGPYTIRGFRVNGVGTGASFLMGSAELTTPIPLIDKIKYDIFKKMRFAFFLDAGRVFQPTVSSELYDRPLGAISVGVGLRIPIPGIGPISIDYGLPLTGVGQYGSKSGYFTFGTGYMEGY